MSARNLRRAKHWTRRLDYWLRRKNKAKKRLKALYLQSKQVRKLNTYGLDIIILMHL